MNNEIHGIRSQNTYRLRKNKIPMIVPMVKQNRKIEEVIESTV